MTQLTVGLVGLFFPGSQGPAGYITLLHVSTEFAPCPAPAPLGLFLSLIPFAFGCHLFISCLHLWMFPKIFSSDPFPLWVSDWPGLRHYLQVLYGLASLSRPRSVSDCQLEQS